MQRLYLTKFENFCLMATQPYLLLQSMMSYVAQWLTESSNNIIINQHILRMLIECLNIDNNLSFVIIKMFSDFNILEILVQQLQPLHSTSTNNNNNNDSNTSNTSTITKEIVVIESDPAVVLLLKQIFELSELFITTTNNNNAYIDMDHNDKIIITNIPLKLLECGLSKSIIIALHQIVINNSINIDIDSNNDNTPIHIDFDIVHNLIQILLLLLTYSIRNIAYYQHISKSNNNTNSNNNVIAANKQIDYIYTMLQSFQQDIVLLLFQLLDICYQTYKTSATISATNTTNNKVDTNSPSTNTTTTNNNNKVDTTEAENFMLERSNSSQIPIIMENITRCLTSVFDLFPEAISTQFIHIQSQKRHVSNNNSPADMSETFNIKKMVSIILSDHTVCNYK